MRTASPGEALRGPDAVGLARLAPDLSHDKGSVDAGDLFRQRVDSAAAETGGNNGGGEYATNLDHGTPLPGDAFSEQ